MPKDVSVGSRKQSVSNLCYASYASHYSLSSRTSEYIEDVGGVQFNPKEIIIPTKASAAEEAVYAATSSDKANLTSVLHSTDRGNCTHHANINNQASSSENKLKGQVGTHSSMLRCLNR